MKYKYGWKPDIPDSRDYIYKRKLKFRLPKKVDLRPYCSKIEEQGKLGSCTAQALAGNIELLDRKDDNIYSDVSRLFIYYNERKIEGTIDQDSGAYIRDGIKSLVKWGVCEERFWPYNITLFKEEPLPECYKKALNNRINLYQRLRGISDILSCLVEGFPVVFGIAIYESFESEKVKKTGIVPMPNRHEVMFGGHAMLIVGYDMAERRLIARNSWGTWGDMGYCYIPFKYVEQLGSDFWTIKKLKEQNDEKDNDSSVGNRFCRWWHSIFGRR